jgi:hypothetical protein
MLMLLCRTATLHAQAFEWGYYGHGCAWKRANALVADKFGNSFFGMEFADALPESPSHQLKFNDGPELGGHSPYHRGIVATCNNTGTPTPVLIIAGDNPIGDATV